MVSPSIGRDWLGKDNEIQFFFDPSVLKPPRKPLNIVGEAESSLYTIQVEVKSLRVNEVPY